jgi:hypothetical protein
MPDEPPSQPDQPPSRESSLLNRAWIETVKAISAAPDAAQALAKSGLTSLQSTLGSLRLFSSTRVDTTAGNPAQDETHYFLIPTANGYVLAERRRLPPGVGTLNSLPKVRLFHVHDQAGVAALEELLVGSLTPDKRQAPGVEDDLAKRLELIGQQIDEQSSLVTGGLVMIGGAVAMANPLLGLGLVAQALLPGLSGKLTQAGLGFAADSVRRLGTSWRERSARKQATSEVRRLKPHVVIDPVLAFLDEQVALATKADPVLRELERLPDWWRDRDQRLTMSVISEVLPADGVWRAWLASIDQRLGDLPS